MNENFILSALANVLRRPVEIAGRRGPHECEIVNITTA